LAIALLKYVLVGSVLYAVSASGSDSPSLCQGDEVSLFNCSSGKKLISVCASKGWSADRGYIQYRFGPAGKPELVVPSKNTIPPMKSATSGVLMFSAGGGAYLRFSSGGYDYVVYTAVGGSWGEKAGVSVEKDGKSQANVACKDEPTSELGPELFKKARFKEDEAGFDLP